MQKQLSNILNILNKNFCTIDDYSMTHNGRNSCIFLLTSNKKDKYILKYYKYDIYNTRNRLKSEYTAIQFMTKIGIKNIPHIYYSDEKFNFSVFEFIEGRKIKNITSYHIDKAVEFIKNINEFRMSTEAGNLMEAAECCFHIEQLLNTINTRLFWLRTKGIDEYKLGLSNLLDALYLFYNKFKMQYYDLIKKFSRHEIRHIDKIISPSDFGYHNALETTNNIYFIDFEYFGWDDAAKLISDFIFHPAMNISYNLKKYFVKKMLNIFHFVPNLKEKLILYCPFVGLNWVLRLLNEFLPERLDKLCTSDKMYVQMNQLNKAKSLLNAIKSGNGYVKIIGGIN